MTWLILGLLGCGDPCLRYLDRSYAYERCVVRGAETAPDLAAARCEAAGASEEDCRITWVEGHRDRPVDELLAACTTPECRFVVLDFAPFPLLEQLGRCEGLGAVAENCVVHAFVRHYAADVSAEEQLSVASRLGVWTGVGAREAALARVCGHPVDCAGFGAEAETCRATPSWEPDCEVYRPGFPVPAGKLDPSQMRASP